MSIEMVSTRPESMSDGELTAEVQRLARSERESTASLVAHLAEFDARRLYLGEGCPSLFVYCTEVLRLSEHEAYNRIEAARLARRFPSVIDLVATGALNLTTARLVAPHLTKENEAALLAEVSYKSKREAEEVIVHYAPRPMVPSSIRRLPSPGRKEVAPGPPVLPSPVGSEQVAGAAVASGVPAGGLETEIQPMGDSPAAEAHPVTDAVCARTLPAMSQRRIIRPLAPARFEIRFIASAETCEKLRLATDLMRHVVPHGDMAVVVDRALTVLLEDLARKKFAATDRPGHAQTREAIPSEGRHIPAAARRAVWLRDAGRCVFQGKGGRRCGARGFLEFHHVRPYAVGGAPTVDNIQLRCRAHNAYESDLFYGPGSREGMAGDEAEAIGAWRARSGTSNER